MPLALPCLAPFRHKAISSLPCLGRGWGWQGLKHRGAAEHP